MDLIDPVEDWAHVERAPEGWILVPVSDHLIKQAQAIRERRDRQYTNIYDEEETDLRWVGEVGEVCLYFWLRACAPGAGRWVLKQSAGKPDFVVRGRSVGLKTVKRQVPFRPHYTAQITGRHAEEPVDYFFFASYEVPERKLWLLGGIRRTDFIAKARYYGPGEQVHAHYVVREGHEIFNIEARFLAPPEEWLKQLTGEIDAFPTHSS